MSVKRIRTELFSLGSLGVGTGIGAATDGVATGTATDGVTALETGAGATNKISSAFFHPP